MRNGSDLALDDVEAALWRLLAGHRIARDAIDVARFMSLIDQYAHDYARRLGSYGRSSGPTALVFSATPVSRAAMPVAPERRKTCSGCSKTLPVSNFYQSSTSKDGYQYVCKDCARLRRQTRRDEIRGSAREKTLARLGGRLLR